MLYKITYLINSDFCNLKPDDKNCHLVARIKANSKTEAIQELHRTFGMSFDQTQRALHSRNVLPKVWEVVEIPER
jgi:hypothetical protein